MAIYGRFGDEVEVVRLGTIDDVQTLDCRKPDDEDRANVRNGCYVVTRSKDDGKERLSAIAFLRADDGLKEIMASLPQPAAN